MWEQSGVLPRPRYFLRAAEARGVSWPVNKSRCLGPSDGQESSCDTHKVWEAPVTV